MFDVVEYDKIKEYENNIEPVVAKLKEVCTLARIPMFVTCAVKNNSKETKYKNEIVHGIVGIKLRDDRIADILLRISGFKIKHPKYVENALNALEKYLDEIEIKGDENIPNTTDSRIDDLARITQSESRQNISAFDLFDDEEILRDEIKIKKNTED